MHVKINKKKISTCMKLFVIFVAVRDGGIIGAEIWDIA